MTDIDGINNPLLKELSINNKTNAKDKELGQADFLNLLVAQMRNQNPLEPQTNGEFLAQLAQFSTVDGIQQMQGSINNLASSLQSNQALQASALVGQKVLVPASSSALPSDGMLKGAVELPMSVQDLKVGIYTASGELVKTLSMGSQQGGLSNFSWDGTNQNGEPMPPGSYSLQATAFLDGEARAFGTFISANVDSVSLGGGGGSMKLNLSGLGTVGLDQVKQIGS